MRRTLTNFISSSSMTSTTTTTTEKLVPFATPFELFDKWYLEAEVAKGEKWPRAMTIATATKEGVPSARMVLMQRKEVGRIAFYTNYTSRKGNDLEENPQAAALFYWNKLERQVRFEGRVEKATPDESDAYFQSRPRDSRIASIASKQSQVLEGGRDQLLSEVESVRESFQVKKQEEDDEKKTFEKEVTRPEHLGMYWIYPKKIEFWEDGEFRVHHRNVYELVNNNEESEEGAEKKGSWKQYMLYP